VVHSEFFDVRFGVSKWLRTARFLALLAGSAAILASPANWIWKLLAIFLLLVVFFLHARSNSAKQSGWVRLYADGTALLWPASGKEIYATLDAHCWVSRWLGVMTLCEPDNGPRHHCIACASDNHPDDYRRLLKFLRMRSPVAEAQRITW